MTDDLKHNDGEAVFDAATGVLGAVGLSSESGYCVERLAGGGFVVLWRDDQGAIKAQIIFSTDGSYSEEQIGEALLVSDAGSSPAVAAQADGGFVAAWLNDKTIEYRVYGHGAENASVLTIDMSDIENIDYVGDPSITVLAGGGFVVTWAMVTDSAPEGPKSTGESTGENTPDGSDGPGGLDGAGDNSQDLYIQHFATNGDPVSEILQIETPAYDLLPDISALPDGGYVLVWNNFSASPTSTKFTNVPVQRYDADNNLVFSTVLSVPDADYYQSPEITGLICGGFVVAFAAKGDASGVMLHLFDSRNIEIDSFGLNGLSGRGLSGNDLVGEGDNVAPRIGALFDGGFVVTWGVGDELSELGDPDYISPGIYAQRFDAFGKAIDNLPQNISGSDSTQGEPQFDAINDSQNGEYHDGDSQDGDSLGDTSLSGSQEVGLTRFTDYLEYDPDSTPESETTEEHLNIVVRFNPDLIDKDGSQSITDIRILLPETVSEQAVFVEADGSPLGSAGMITLETTTGMVIWANYHTFGGNNLHIAFPKYDGEGNPYPDLTGENINLENQIQVRLPLEDSSNFSPNFAPNFSPNFPPDFSMDIIYTTAEVNAAGEVTEYIDHDTFTVSGPVSGSVSGSTTGENLGGDSDEGEDSGGDTYRDTDTGQQQTYADVNLWAAIEEGFDPNNILKDDPLVDTGHLSKAIQQIFISLAGNQGRFLSNEEPLRNNSVVYVMALYVDQSGYFKFGPIKAAVFIDENGDLILTFEEVLVQAVTLSPAFGDFGISLELPGELPDEGLGDLNLPTETTIILYDGEALQEYFEKIQNNQEADALALRDAGGSTSTIEGSFDLTVESLTGSSVIAQTGYDTENAGFLDSEDGVFFFAEDAQADPEDQATGTTGPLQIDVAYSISTALVLAENAAENATENATGDEGGDGQANEDPQSAGDNASKAITQITIELVAIRDINYQGKPGESGERVDLAFKEGVSINAAGDQVTFYVDRDGNLREDGNLSGDGSGARKITAELIRAEDGNAITLKFVDGLSGPQMIDKLELGSLIKAVLAKHSDADFDIKITVETTVYGDDNNALGTASNVDQYTISIDAVADRGTLDFTGNQDVVQLDENAHITISVDVSFDDYADGSEDHSIVLNNVPAAWVLLSDALLISGPTASAEYPGLVSYRFDVSALVDAGNGSASLPIEFDPQDWTPACGDQGGDQGGGLDNSEGHGHVGGHAEIEVQAVATEANLSGDDYLSDNNVATTTNYITVSMDAYVPGYFVPSNLVPGENEPGDNDPVHVVNLGDGNDSFDDHAPGSVIDLVKGGVGDDIIWTGDGDDILIGGSGDDRLYGEGGDDLLIGGAGDDILKGGSGADSFIFTGEDLGGSDAIRDFRVDQGDNLNLRELLDDDGSLAAAGDNAALATALESYLDISSDGISTTIVVDGDGSEPGTDVATITLENVDLTVGGSLSEHDAIQALLDNNNLIIE